MKRKVKALLVERDIKQKEIAIELGVRLATVSGVINGHHQSRRIKEYIARRLGKPYQWCWGKAA